MISGLNRFSGRALAFVLAIALTATGAFAETLMMPERDALVGTDVVVWGVSTLPNGTAFTLECGDSLSTQVSGTVSDRSFIPIVCNYTSAGIKTATLTVGSEVATVEVQAFDGTVLSAEDLRNLGINMAIEDGLRSLWTTQSGRQANFPASSTTVWTGGYEEANTAFVALAFQNHGYSLANDGSAPTGLYEKYIVRRALNYVLSRLTTVNLGFETGVGDPCVGSGVSPAWDASDCVGLTTNRGDHRGYITAVVTLPFAASGALNRVNAEIAGVTAGMTFGEVLQRLSNANVWGQTNSGANEGGFGYNFNGGQFDGSTVGWGVLALLDADAAGAVVPAYAKTAIGGGAANAINADGSFDYNAAPGSSSDGPHKVGIGLQVLFIIGETTGSRVTAVTANINSWWNGPTGGIGNNGWGCGGVPGLPYPNDTNKGCAYSMFNNFKGLKLHGIQTLPNVGRPAGPGAIPANDWHEDYKDWLVANQSAPTTLLGGSWGPAMGFSCCYGHDVAETAIAELLLSPVALVLPDGEKFSTFGLSPETDTDQVGGTHTVIAHAESTGGNAVPGATVNFEVISGPNSGATGSDVTDATGNAEFTYTDGSLLGGTDNIQASIGALESNIVEMNWIPPNVPPDVSGALPTSTCMWPPNHKFETVGIVGITDEDGDDLTITITGITSDEPTATAKGVGGKDKGPDASIVGSDVALRIERMGGEDGRVYEISFDVSDGTVTVSGSVRVGVPHDQGDDTCGVDSGQNYDATAIN